MDDFLKRMKKVKRYISGKSRNQDAVHEVMTTAGKISRQPLSSILITQRFSHTAALPAL